MTQAKSTPPKCTIGVYPDKGSLRLSFSTRYNALLEQLGQPARRQHTFALNLPDTEQNRKRATQAAIDIEADLQHKDWIKLFDPTFVKYGIGDAKFAQKLAEVIQMPQTKTAMTVGEMWEDYLIWKEGQVQPTTFKKRFLRTYSNAIKGLKWDSAQGKQVDSKNSIYNLPLDATIGEKAQDAISQAVGKVNSSNTLAALREAYDRAMKLGKIPPTNNPFVVTKCEKNNNQHYAPQQDENGVWREWWWFEDVTKDEYLKDTRHFTITERDAIIKAFYESNKVAERHASPLIEFLFLTGCRHGEAFGLRWKDVSFERGYVRFSKSFDKETNGTQQTKTGTIRMFKLYPPLTELLQRIQSASTKVGKNDLVFTLMNGNPYGTSNISDYWRGQSYKVTNKKKEEIEYTYPGVVTKLTQEGVIGGYLNPYSTRHTFITLQAQAGVSLPLLAAVCGNSVDVIYRHYLGIDKDAELIDV